MKAQDLINLFTDSGISEITNDWKDEYEKFGATLYGNTIFNKIHDNHIQSFYGKIMFVSTTSKDKIKKILGYKCGYYCKVLMGEKEKKGAEKFRKIIINKLKL